MEKVTSLLPAFRMRTVRDDSQSGQRPTEGSYEGQIPSRKVKRTFPALGRLLKTLPFTPEKVLEIVDPRKPANP